MFIQVQLLHGFSELLWYKVPATWPAVDFVGCLVTVPLRKKIIAAMVQRVCAEKPNVSFVIKEAHSWQPLPSDPCYKKFIDSLSYYYQLSNVQLFKRIRQFLIQEQTDIVTSQQEYQQPTSTIQLTGEQQQVVDFLMPTIGSNTYVPTLLHGVTGSGKTEIYKKLIEHAQMLDKTVLLLLPEVSLAVQFTQLLKQQLPSSIEIFGFHSATSVKEKRLLWQRLLQNSPVLIVGVHLPVLLPISNLGLIIVDEEHDTGFQEKKYPRINSKEAALWRAQHNKIPILLGSATPSISSLYNVKKKGWHFFQLKQRFAGQFPKVTMVQLDNATKRKNFWISKKLEQSIEHRLAVGQQTILFLNRRGFSFFVQCKQCNFVFSCSNCSVSLTLHDHNMLMCHYCGLSMQQASHCPACKVDQKEFLKKGIGTQQLVTILQKIFPHARIGRADLDATINKKMWQATIHDFEQGKLDILIGTQTITKGYHFPRVTLVGIIWADLNLHFPLFNASETTLQQLIQVAGRAGRQLPGSEVIVQMMMDHAIFDYIHEIDYVSFYNQEIEARTAVGYPPVMRLVEVELKYNDESVVEADAKHLCASLVEQCSLLKYHITILGPARPLVHKIKNSYSRKIYLKGASIQELINLFVASTRRSYTSSTAFTPNPLS